MKEERLQRLTHFVEEVRDQAASIESQLADIERSLVEINDIIEAERAHSKAVASKDAREQLEVGDVREVVIESPPGREGPDAVTRINGIVTFVAPQDLSIDVTDTVRVKITDVGESHAKAVATEILE